MSSERKKVFALLELRQRLEKEYVSSPLEATKEELGSIDTKLSQYFRCDSIDDMLKQYPTAEDMKVAAEKQRYFASRKTNHQRVGGEIYEDLRRNGTDEDYLEFVRVSKSAFFSISSSIMCQHEVFMNRSNNSQESVEKQLAITLWRLGHYGNEAGIGEASKIFGLSEGSIMKCTKRCIQVLKEISSDLITWPSQDEKRTIKLRAKSLVASAVTATKTTTTIPTITFPYSAPIQLPTVLSQKGPSSKSASKTGGYEETQNSPCEILDTVGILSVFYVLLASRPLLKNTEDYLIPLHPSTIAAAQTLSEQGQKSSKEKRRNLKSNIRLTKDSNKNNGAIQNNGTRNSNDSSSNKDNGDGIDNSEGSINYQRIKKLKISRKKRGKKAEDEDVYENRQEIRPEMTIYPEENILSPVFPAPVNNQSADQPAAPVAPLAEGMATHQPGFIRIKYLKRDYGYKVLFVSDTTTRIRFVDAPRPAGWTNQQTLMSSPLLLESTKFFEDNEYLVAGPEFESSANVVSMHADGDALGGAHLQLSVTMADSAAQTQTSHYTQNHGCSMDMNSHRTFEESLRTIQKRALDCQRTLKARFPSLVELRLQVKDDITSLENVREWIEACMTIHNLVLGDESSYNMAWEEQLREKELWILKQQEEQVRLMWKLEHKQKS